MAKQGQVFAIAAVTAAVVAVVVGGVALSNHANSHSIASDAAPPSPAPSSTFPTPASTDSSADPSSICGSWSASTSPVGSQITSSFGQIRSCLKVNNSWVIFTDGVYDSNSTVTKTGVILVDDCSKSNAATSCEDGSSEHAFSDFSAFTPPVAGPVRLLAAWDAPILLVATNSGDIQFDVATDTYSAPIAYASASAQ
jgi:hypothetical protein